MFSSQQELMVLCVSDVDKLEGYARSGDDVALPLKRKISRAEITVDSRLPASAVALNSRVTLKDIRTGALVQITLVEPSQTDPDTLHLSVLSPVGLALIGQRLGDRIKWEVEPGRTRFLKVIGVE